MCVCQVICNGEEACANSSIIGSDVIVANGKDVLDNSVIESSLGQENNINNDQTNYTLDIWIMGSNTKNGFTIKCYDTDICNIYCIGSNSCIPSLSRGICSGQCNVFYANDNYNYDDYNDYQSIELLKCQGNCLTLETL